MATIVYRETKGSPLTNAEVDANLTNINAETVDNSTAYRLRPSLDVDLVGSKTVSPLLSFNRGSTGTYYDGKTAVKAEENLLTYSEQINNWVANNIQPFGSGSTIDAIVAPNGTQTADFICENTSSGVWHYVKAPTINLQANLTYSLSVYVKPAGRTWVALNVSEGTSAYWFNLTSTGSVGSTTTGTGVISNPNISSVANGWYRISAQYTHTSSITGSLTVYMGSADNTGSYQGDGTSGIYVWGAQLEQRSSVTAYTPTTTSPITNYIPQLLTAPANTPRFDHDPVSGELKGLLVEESRTNLITSSSNFTAGGWSTTGSTISSNVCVSPEGNVSGTKITEDSSSGRHLVQIGTSPTFPATLSIFAKAAERSKFFVGDGQVGAAVVFDLTGDGSIFSQNSSYAPIKITNVGNGWYRCSITKPSSGAGSTMWVGIADATGQTTYQGDTTKGLYIWGAQIESGNTLTSYIPTTTAAVTRSADQLSISKTSNWFNSVNGTLALAHDAASGQPLLGDGATTILSSLGAGTINIDYSNSQLPVVTQSGQTTATQGIFNFDSDLQILGNSTTKANARIKYMKFYPNNVIGSTPEGSGFILDDGYAMLQEDGSVLFQE